MSIKAIETVYNGRRFRSRLEAKWSLFLDTLGVNYRYEPEGYNLNGEVNYLPDFYIDDWQCWLEVKGPSPTDKEQRKAYLLSRESGDPVIIAHGSFVLSEGHLFKPSFRVFYGTAEQLFERTAYHFPYICSRKNKVVSPIRMHIGGVSTPLQILQVSTEFDGDFPRPYCHTLDYYKRVWEYISNGGDEFGSFSEHGWVNAWPDLGDDHCLRAIVKDKGASWPILMPPSRLANMRRPVQQITDAAEEVMQHRFINFNSN